MTGGTVSAYIQVLALFHKDAEDRLPILQTLSAKQDLAAFTTQVHALKSSSASLGAAELAAEAAKLETAGKTGDRDFIKDNLPAFIWHLTDLVKGIRSWKTAAQQGSPQAKDGPAETPPAALALLRKLAAALESQKAQDIDRILDELEQKPLDAKTKEALRTISDYVLMAEFGGALECVRKLAGQTGDSHGK